MLTARSFPLHNLARPRSWKCSKTFLTNWYFPASVCLFICLCVCLSVYLSVCLFVASQREGEKVCLGCDEQVYCGRCWTMEHKDEDMAGHLWKGADSGKYSPPPSACCQLAATYMLTPCQKACLLNPRLQYVFSPRCVLVLFRRHSLHDNHNRHQVICMCAEWHDGGDKQQRKPNKPLITCLSSRPSRPRQQMRQRDLEQAPESATDTFGCSYVPGTALPGIRLSRLPSEDDTDAMAGAPGKSYSKPKHQNMVLRTCLATPGKEDLSPGERHCVDCGFRKAKWACLQCKVWRPAGPRFPTC